jgi:hypothetical protein
MSDFYYTHGYARKAACAANEVTPEQAAEDEAYYTSNSPAEEYERVERMRDEMKEKMK